MGTFLGGAKNDLEINEIFRMDYHKNELERACRVCGKRLCKAKKRERSHLVQEHSSELAQVFQIDTSGDSEDTHPTLFCHPCWTVYEILAQECEKSTCCECKKLQDQIEVTVTVQQSADPHIT